ncbi:MAG TPA: four helix bundle protein [Flavipsychrobacter sp.]|nr:four helix bundle protein [Flavipsychrobacter sp.]
MAAHTYYFEKLDVWQNAKRLAVSIYAITEKFPSNEKFALTDQLRRSAVSVSANIAEGSTREHLNDYVRFMNIAYGSCIEVLNHILIAKELNYVSDSTLNEIRDQVSQITNQLRALNKSVIAKKRSNEKTQQQ